MAIEFSWKYVPKHTFLHHATTITTTEQEIEDSLMSLYRNIAKRSTGGCLTCKRRKKKCDEARPCCRRCELGDFHCLGYENPDSHRSAAEELNATQVSLFRRPSETPASQSERVASLQLLDDLVPLPEYGNQIRQPCSNHAFLQEVRNHLSNIPRGILLDAMAITDATSLILSQYPKFTQEIFFKPFATSFESGLLWRIDNSNISLWSMYLVARTVKDVMSGRDAQKYLNCIFRFCRQILETPPTGIELDSTRLGSLYDLLSLVLMISGTTSGYSLLKCCAPVFLQLAAHDPNLWSDDSTISILEAIRQPRYEIAQFVINDTIAALVLGTPPLLHYDSTLVWTAEAPFHYQLVHGFPIGILLFLAKANAWRASQLMKQGPPCQGEWSDLDEQLDSWNPTIDYTDCPRSSINRFAIQEAWRQAAKIYLYMVVKAVNSADARVESAVRQIVQLQSVPEGNPQKSHFLVPCLLAGIAARQEKHRAALRSSVSNQGPLKINTLMLRGPDFVPVLDHLWHGVGSQGNPVTWEDYVQSRCSVLPI
ncbi:hypothetical protein RHS03_08093, partial [Rhizoctonia solani]